MSFAMNRVLMKIFCSRSSAVVEECRTVFGVPSITDQIHTRKINFYGNSVNQIIACALYLLAVRPESALQFVDK